MTITKQQEGAVTAPSTIRPHTRTHRPQSDFQHTTHHGRCHAPVYNRIRVLMVHAPRYSFQGQARLAADAGVSRSTISRLIGGRINPSFRLAQAVTAALEKHLKRPLDLRELLSPDGAYPTASGCALTGCRGCMPEEAYDAEGSLKPEYKDLRPGDWSLARPSLPVQLPHHQSQEDQSQKSPSQQHQSQQNNIGKEKR